MSPRFLKFKTSHEKHSTMYLHSVECKWNGTIKNFCKWCNVTGLINVGFNDVWTYRFYSSPLPLLSFFSSFYSILRPLRCGLCVHTLLSLFVFTIQSYHIKCLIKLLSWKHPTSCWQQSNLAWKYSNRLFLRNHNFVYSCSVARKVRKGHSDRLSSNN